MFKNLLNKVNKHAPELLLGVGIAGMITSVVLAVKATPKAEKLIKEAKKEKGDDLTITETIKTAWVPYVPTGVMMLLTGSSFILSNRLSNNQKMAYVALYHLTKNALEEYQANTLAEVGENKEQKIRNNTIKTMSEKTLDTSTSTNLILSDNDMLCQDVMFGKTFVSNIDKIRRAENEINYQLNTNDYVSLNEFYGKLNVEPIDLGWDVGWNYGTGLVNITYIVRLTTEKDAPLPLNQPILCFKYDVNPRYDYSKLM